MLGDMNHQKEFAEASDAARFIQECNGRNFCGGEIKVEVRIMFLGLVFKLCMESGIH
jgi:hypothetical protein